jgi:hypothetical protein
VAASPDKIPAIPKPDIVDTPLSKPRPQVKREEAAATNRKPVMAVLAALGLILVAGVATLAYLRRNEPPAMARAPAPPPAPVPPQASSQPKINDRVTPGGEAPSQSAAPLTPAPAAPPAQVPAAPQAPAQAGPPPARPPQVSPPLPVAVANRALLLSESTTSGAPLVQQLGSIVWRFEQVSGGQGQSLQQAIVGRVDIPDGKVKVEITVQKNRDAAFPASHLIQTRFTPEAGSELGAIRSLNVFELRQVDNQPGYALQGQGIAVTDNVFLVALAQIEPSLSRNVEMLRTRAYLYLEFQTVSGRRGGLVLEKGVSGQQVFDEAFQAWQ